MQAHMRTSVVLPEVSTGTCTWTEEIIIIINYVYTTHSSARVDLGHRSIAANRSANSGPGCAVCGYAREWGVN